MALIEKDAIERLILRTKAQVVGPEDIIALRTAIGAEAEARKAADKVVSFSVTPTLESESQGVRRWRAKVNTSVEGIVLNCVRWDGTSRGFPAGDVYELGSYSLTETLQSGIVLETSTAEEIETVHIWVFKI